MRLCDKRNYAYILIQLIKTANGCSLDSVFTLDDFNLVTLNICDCAIGTISMSDLQDVLRLIEKEQYKLEKQKQSKATYQDMRQIFEPTAFYR